MTQCHFAICKFSIFVLHLLAFRYYSYVVSMLSYVD